MMIKVRIFFLGFLLTTICQAQNSDRLDGFHVEQISDSVFMRMYGHSFPKECTVSRSDLRYLRLRHYDANGKVHDGEMVCNKAIAQDLIEIFEELFRQHYPIERIRLIDDYDADDEKSMRDNNTSCFCFRAVAGSRTLSKHALGMAVDINTLYNPCVRHRRDGSLLIQPSTAVPYADRSRKFKYKIERGDLLYNLFLQHGFRWGGGWRTVKDYQHFEK